MDGSARQVLLSAALLSASIAYPAGLGVDRLEKRIFWTDPTLNIVGSSDYNGKNVRLFPIPVAVAKTMLGIAVHQVSDFQHLRRTNVKTVSSFAAARGASIDWCSFWVPHRQLRNVRHTYSKKRGF
jgi:hypothetical protein